MQGDGDHGKHFQLDRREPISAAPGLLGQSTSIPQCISVDGLMVPVRWHLGESSRGAPSVQGSVQFKVDKTDSEIGTPAVQGSIFGVKD